MAKSKDYVPFDPLSTPFGGIVPSVSPFGFNHPERLSSAEYERRKAEYKIERALHGEFKSGEERAFLVTLFKDAESYFQKKWSAHIIKQNVNIESSGIAKITLEIVVDTNSPNFSEEAYRRGGEKSVEELKVEKLGDDIWDKFLPEKEKKDGES
jgi:hypothetical protein